MFDGTKWTAGPARERDRIVIGLTKRKRYLGTGGVLFAVLLAAWAAGESLALGVERLALAAAVESVTAGELQRHIEFLADDSLEGRAAGSRGGRAAAVYLAREFERRGLAGGATPRSYFQEFGGGRRNVLGIVPGSDPTLREQYVLVCAHYDHVGFGDRETSNGPVGFIHNGADDNASGVAAVLEIADAVSRMPTKPRRSILFALWDDEERGLYGSKHWISEPTVPKAKISAALNLDMVGRLRRDRLEVYGTRTAAGLRRLVSEQNEESGLLLDWSWEMKADSDHHTLFEAGIPVLMFHTGLHDDYHRPSDDAPRIDLAGTQRVSRLALRTVVELAEEESPRRFRGASRAEAASSEGAMFAALAPLPPRMGVRWGGRQGKTEGLVLSGVEPGSPAERAGLQAGDRVESIDGEPVADVETARARILASEGPLKVRYVRGVGQEPREVVVRLAGAPVRLGITWRRDDSEPDVFVLVRVTPGTPAARAGLQVRDRITAVDGERLTGEEGFRRAIGKRGEREMLVERAGRLFTVRVTGL